MIVVLICQWIANGQWIADSQPAVEVSSQPVIFTGHRPACNNEEWMVRSDIILQQ
jgi:hypothetical protein